jgi:NADPH:quinone reductase-like Zn-dependent oxidoreductase
MRLVARGGTVVTLGNSAKEPTSFNTNEFFSIGGARLYGFHLVVHEMVVDPVSADLGYLARLVADGQLDPQIALEANWREAGPALAALLDRRVDGKAVLHLR